MQLLKGMEEGTEGGRGKLKREREKERGGISMLS